MKSNLLFILVICPTLIFAQLAVKSVATPQGTIGFYEYRPKGYNPDSSYNYPLIIFMHGIGQRGNGSTDLPMMMMYSFPKLIAGNPTMNFTVNGRRYAFMVLIPQLPVAYNNWENFYVDAMIDYAKKNLKIDTNKIFLTGWSLGGGGAWKYVTASTDNANRIAGIIPVAPSPNYTNLDNIARGSVAVWAHHARNDIISVVFTEYAIKIINAASPVIPAQVTYYTSGGHSLVAEGAYDTLNTYQYPNMYQWMAGTSRLNTPTNNKDPIPIAGNDTTIIIPAVKTVLDGAASYDPNDVIVNYSWTLLHATVPTPGLTIEKPNYPVTAVSGLTLGTYIFRLQVTDQFGIVKCDDVTVHIALPAHGENANPLVDAGADFTTSFPNYHIHGHATDFDGTISQYQWRQVSGPLPVTVLGRGEVADIVGMYQNGTYGIELTAFDNHNPHGIGKDTVLITKDNKFPLVVFYWSMNNNIADAASLVHFSIFSALLVIMILPAFSYRFYYRHR